MALDFDADLTGKNNQVPVLPVIIKAGELMPGWLYHYQYPLKATVEVIITEGVHQGQPCFFMQPVHPLPLTLESQTPMLYQDLEPKDAQQFMRDGRGFYELAGFGAVHKPVVPIHFTLQQQAEAKKSPE